jgi:hypothetical protein
MIILHRCVYPDDSLHEINGIEDRTDTEYDEHRDHAIAETYCGFRKEKLADKA